MVFGQLRHFVFVDGGDARAIGATEILARRRSGVRIGIVKSGSVGSENRCVYTSILGNARETRTVKTSAIQMPLKGRFFGGGKIHQALGLIDPIE
jgi:hypothetical protein